MIWLKGWKVAVDIIGERFGEWLVLERDCSVSSKKSKYICKCSCGTKRSLFRHNLLKGRTSHCGCKSRSLDERFWEKVDKSGDCWIWTGAKDLCGYGRVSIGGKVCSAHRASYELAYGKIEEPSFEVCHKCDEPACVNPNHLHLGTHKENMREAVIRNRFSKRARGESHHNSKLSEEDVRFIREEYNKGAGIRYLARKFGVSKVPISRIVKGLAWRHV